MDIHTIGFTQKTAEQFFGLLRVHGIKHVVDIRLKNTSQLAAFTRKGDLPFFLKELCGAGYEHQPILAPTNELLTGYRKNDYTWSDYERIFNELLEERAVEQELSPETFSQPTVLLCAEPEPNQCHRRLVAEYLQRKWGGVTITHL